MSTSTALLLSLLLLLGNAFFVGASFAAMATRRSTLEPLAAEGSSRARSCLEALEHLGSMLATSQLGITVCSLGLGALAESALHHVLAPMAAWFGLSQGWADGLGLAGALLVVVYLHVVVGEMIPKNIAIAGPDRSALILVPMLLFVSRVLRPLVIVMEHVAKALVRVLGVEPKDEVASAFTAEEVAHIVAESHREGLLEGEREGLVSNALTFSDKVAADVSVPMDQVTTVELGVTAADVERLVARHGFSRFPVRDSEGQPVGYLHLKDVLHADGERYEQPISLTLVRRLATVSAADGIEEVLATMQRTGAHLARVLGEDGTTLGVVFLEDVIEELVGDVTDASQR